MFVVCVSACKMHRKGARRGPCLFLGSQAQLKSQSLIPEPYKELCNHIIFLGYRNQ